MMRDVLIDGYNLIRQSGKLAGQERRGGLEAGREALMRVLAAYRRATGDRVTVVFDGDEGVGFVAGAGRRDGMKVVFSRYPETADDLIMRRIRRKHGKKAMLVVSSDREIRREAKRNRISVMKAEAFETEMYRRASRGPETRAAAAEEPAVDDVAYWEEVFRKEKGMFEEE